MRRFICILLSLIMVVIMLPSAAFASSCVKLEMSINPYGNEESSIDTIKWYQIGLQYFFFLPSDCDLNSLKVFCNKTGVTVNGKRIVSGEETNVFNKCGCYTVKCGAEDYSVRVMKSENIPAMYLNTEEPLSYINKDKENKSKAEIRIYENGKISLNEKLKQIKGRGNSTWLFPKKPYNIKFDKKTSVLGMDKAKKWTLLANFLDPGSMKNPTAWLLAKILGLKYTSDYRYVDLYINGEYLGTYIVCESVEVGENRVNITDLEKETENVNIDDLENYTSGGTDPGNKPFTEYKPSAAKWINIPNNPDDITGGYLLECDLASRMEDEKCAFITDRRQLVTLKAPEYASKEQVNYIRSYWQEAEDAFCSPTGFNAKGKHYSEYFDMDSLVDMYILQELSGNLDGGISSNYFYKDQAGKLVASPVWDFDAAFGQVSLRGDIMPTDPSQWVTNRLNYNMDGRITESHEYPTIFTSLYRHEDFRNAVSKRWQELRSSGALSTEALLERLNAEAEWIAASSKMNGNRWIEVFTDRGVASAVNETVGYLKARIDWLDKGFGKNSAQLFYDVNGGEGWTLETKIHEKGDIVVVNKPYGSNLLGVRSISLDTNLLDLIEVPIKAPKGKEFAGWNTEKDGSGRMYKPGDLIKLNGITTLYAQWKPKPCITLIPENKLSDKSLRPAFNLVDSLANVIDTYL